MYCFMSACDACDPNSTEPHAIQTTRFRIANLCCSGEEKIIRKSLETLKGIEDISINIIGRYAIIQHCPTACCAPGDIILQILNDKRLGASIQEVGGQDEGDEDADDLSSKIFRISQVFVTFFLFVVGLVLQFAEDDETLAMWPYIVSTIIGVGPLLYASAVTVFIRKSLDINVLMVIAITGAVASGEYFDGSLVVSLFLTAELIESIIMEHVRAAVNLSSAVSIPKEAFLANGYTKKVDELEEGDVIAVRAGEMILGDGVVVRGEGVVDESSLTGESVPLNKTVGSSVLSGTVVQNGYMEVKVLTENANSTLLRLKQAVKDVQADRGQYAKLTDQFAQVWTPLVLLTSAAFVVVGGLVTGDWFLFLHRGLVLLVLACPCAVVIAAPIPSVCAIATAAKNGVLIRGSSVIERMGLVDTVALDKTGTLTRGFFKVHQRVVFGEEDDEDMDPLRLAAAIESKSTHPLANAVVAEFTGCVAEAEESLLPVVRKVEVKDGVGVSGWVSVNEDWVHVAVGNERLLKENGGKVITTAEQKQKIQSLSSATKGQVLLYVVVEDELSLVLTLADEVRAESRAFCGQLGQLALEVFMLTGDEGEVAGSISREVGITADHCLFRLMPNQKLCWIQKMQQDIIRLDIDAGTKTKVDEKSKLQKYAHEEKPSEQLDAMVINLMEESIGSQHTHQLQHQLQHQVELQDDHHLPGSSLITDSEPTKNRTNRKTPPKKVLMIGDGINDSAALAAAQVGVAMGAGGSAMAVNAADVVLLTDNLLLLPPSLKLTRFARRIMILNCVFAILIKIMAIVLALLGYLDFWHAVLIDLGSLLVVVAFGVTPLFLPVYEEKT